MIKNIKVYIPSVVYRDQPLNERFQYPSYGTLSINGRPPIPLPLESLLLIQEELRLVMEAQDA